MACRSRQAVCMWACFQNPLSGNRAGIYIWQGTWYPTGKEWKLYNCVVVLIILCHLIVSEDRLSFTQMFRLIIYYHLMCPLMCVLAGNWWIWVLKYTYWMFLARVSHRYLGTLAGKPLSTLSAHSYCGATHLMSSTLRPEIAIMKLWFQIYWNWSVCVLFHGIYTLRWALWNCLPYRCSWKRVEHGPHPTSL